MTSVTSPPLTGRRALVTGAASGIGAALARRLAADGAQVLAVDRDEAGLAGEVACVEPVLELEPASVKRLVEPEEIAELAAVLYGPASASITGASLSMDGGWTAH